jgi:hypothetical protein
MSITKGSFNLQLQGHPAANRDAVVRLVNTATGQTIERKPFLDGTLTVRDIDLGPWEVVVNHPNLINPLYRDTVTVLPQPRPTYVPIPIPAVRFEDNPIRDIPDADLGPIQQATTAVRAQMAPIAAKASGEVIRADDWNHLVAAVNDLASAVLELTRLVSPHGHDHPEIATKIDEVQGNVRRFVDSFGKSLLELRREIENRNLRKATTDMLDAAGVVGVERDAVIGRVIELETLVQANPIEYTSKLATTGRVLAAEVNRLAQAQGEAAETFLASEATRKVMTIAETLSTSGTKTGVTQELETYRLTSAATGGAKLSWAGGL